MKIVLVQWEQIPRKDKTFEYILLLVNVGDESLRFKLRRRLLNEVCVDRNMIIKLILN